MRVGRWWWMALALTLGLTPMPVLRVSQAQSLMMVAGGTSSESFWVKSQTRNSSTGLTRTGLEEHKGKTTAKPSIGSRVAMDGLKKNNSIASELAGTKSVPWSIVLGLTFLTLIPALLLSMTPLVRLLVIFHFLRQALGTQTAPSNQVLMGLALMMTWFLIQPVLLEVEQQAVTPYSAGTITGMEAMERGVIPVKRYMLRYAREKDLAVFASAGMGVRPEHREDLPVQVVVPAYILSELKAGFQIGAILFLPFLLVDLVVASITTSIGMVQLPPVVISTPLKILLFVMVDGWNLLADQLIKSF
jgi:flagellar biosynthesis protein FliP